MRLRKATITLLAIFIVAGISLLVFFYFQIRCLRRLYFTQSEPDNMAGCWQIVRERASTEIEYEKQSLILNQDNTFEYHFVSYPYLLYPFLKERPSEFWGTQSPIKGNWEIQTDEEGCKFIRFKFVFGGENYNPNFPLYLNERRKSILISLGFVTDVSHLEREPIRFYKTLDEK